LSGETFDEAAVAEVLVALARTSRRNEEIFWNEVTVVAAASGSSSLTAMSDVGRSHRTNEEDNPWSRSARSRQD
jgi:hypothetical protein